VALTHLSELQQRLPVRAARISVALSRDNMSRLARFSNKINKFKGKIVWCLPAVVHEKDLSWYEQQLQRLVRGGYSRFELGHCSQYGLFAFVRESDQACPVELYGSYSLNLLNSAALHCAAHLGYTGVQFSLETEQDNLEISIAHFKRHRGRGRFQQRMKVGLYVYGRPPLFTARLAGEHFQYKKPFVSPKQEQFVLEQSNGLTLARAVQPFSLLKWQQELQAMQVDYLLLDLSGGPVPKESAMVQTLLTRGGSRMSVLSGNFQGSLV
jgi:putative protease